MEAADVPPLEDMSELIKQVDALREMKKQQHGATGDPSGLQNGHSHKDKATAQQPKETKQSDKKDSSSTAKKDSSVKENKETPKTQPSSSQNKSSGFGGMKKGFLFGGPAKPKQPSSVKSAEKSAGAKPPKKTLEDIPFIKKNDEPKSDKLRFSEVQEAMEKTTSKLMENKAWVTEDLLDKMEKNEKLAKRLQDPTFLQAIGEFQKNPQVALTKYGDNKEVQEFFQEFCALMGDHFSSLPDPGLGGNAAASATSSSTRPDIVTTSASGGSADLQVRSSTNPNQPTAQDEAKMQQILSDQEVRFILMDPKIQELFEHLRNDPVKAQKLMQDAGSELKEKIQRLISMGLLQFQTG